AIAHLATEYVFSDFLLKEPTEPKFKGLRLELAVDKMVTCIAVGLPLLLISLAFAQEISIGTQISCFSPSSFSWRQAAFVDSYCWAAVQQKNSLQSESGNLPLWLHKFFPYILLLFAILLYLPPLFWRFAAAPHICSDLKFIMEELDKVYNRAIKAAKSARDLDMRDGACSVWSHPQFEKPGVTENLGQSLWEVSESHFKYPIVEQYLKTKKNSNNLIIKYISCRLLTLIIILLACIYLGYYFSLSSLSDEFVCSIKSGILRNDSTVPDQFQCKLIAVGIFQLLSVINLVVYVLLAPVVVYTLFVPFRQKTDVLKVYEILPTFDVLHFKSEGYNDLSLYNLFLEENISEVKSYKCLKVLENIKSSGQGIDPMLLLTNLGMIKMDVVDGKTPMSAEMREEQGNQTAELQGMNIDSETKANNGEKNARQRLLDSSC
uniref:Pannexin-1 n=1 Tax=Homo sapiens TaxID=9606 RepID=UPI001BCA67CB|nr:Chain A, Pannexin-1 [Homo sapiens]7DWB_B Chain B, Pannexin-1 [Homo sapiens]7DWB_C Chain C, Pannexin-1 [Homo sapiens]7DWB_D Chain D, Pannexin-1 [Homo sapiens]7DWB_E Chain E, Pannexin-1 [Homo sapiens]7DWB_F Chain F, Pannexin-1 [Homo sapiens]7DWB_G Chain G, Pannexin-1 [Homo sapiens]